jgi:hypothetical protein
MEQKRKAARSFWRGDRQKKKKLMGRKKEELQDRVAKFFFCCVSN